MANQVITRKALRNEMIKTLSQHERFKSFIHDLRDKLQEFIRREVYATAFKFVLDTGFDFKVHYKYNDKEEDFELNIKPFSAEITIRTSIYKPIDTSTSKIVNIIVDIILNAISSEDLRHTGVFQSLEVKDNFHTYNKLIAWSSGSVGIYYIEQECGEGWIILPKEPKENNFKGFYNFK